MKIVKKISEMQKVIANLKHKGKTIGFVPTMGALHEGHLSLMKRAKKENDVVVASIFVNPAQFGPKEDFRRYPRNLKKDAGLCMKAGVDYIFAPPVKEMYPQGYSVYIEAGGRLTEILEGKSRPGHFRGVTTIVAKLFNIVFPDRAYFGEKDYQQLLVIKKMVSGLNMPIKIVPCKIVREKDGLAMSSRNAYLGRHERSKALLLNQALLRAKHAVFHHGFRDSVKLQESIKSAIKSPDIKLDYVQVCDGRTLEPVKNIKTGCVILVAVKIGKTRLIDNVKI